MFLTSISVLAMFTNFCGLSGNCSASSGNAIQSEIICLNRIMSVMFKLRHITCVWFRDIESEELDGIISLSTFCPHIMFHFVVHSPQTSNISIVSFQFDWGIPGSFFFRLVFSVV
jgi:hypothetical protein